MHQPKLPMPNPADWMTQRAAAELLGVSTRTVTRMVVDGKLSLYWPKGGQGEKRPALFWWPEVQAYATARRITKEGVDRS